jgi:hypothetical protein
MLRADTRGGTLHSVNSSLATRAAHRLNDDRRAEANHDRSEEKEHSHPETFTPEVALHINYGRTRVTGWSDISGTGSPFSTLCCA